MMIVCLNRGYVCSVVSVVCGVVWCSEMRMEWYGIGCWELKEV